MTEEVKTTTPEGGATAPTKAKPEAAKKGGKQEPKNEPKVTTTEVKGKRVVKLPSGLTVTYN